jgi:predicted NUDIX family NTP pyrophosphohydrolase
MIYPFVYVENSYTRLNWDELEIKCNSNVPAERGGFPEMDAYKWVTLEEARPLLHETQAACLDKIKELVG